MISELIENELKSLVNRLVEKDFDGIVAASQQGRLYRDEIELAIADYPGSITMPPDEAFSEIDIYDVYDDETGARNCEFNLWCDGEKSNLTLSFVAVGKDDNFKIGITDIRVM